MDLQDINLLRSGIKRLIDADTQHNLRDKQVEAFRALVSGKFTDQQIAHSYFKLPTGFGKTVMFATMARAYFDAVKAAGAKRQKIIIIVPRLSLINQTKEKLDKFADLVATEFSGRVKENKSDIVITTYNSLATLFGTVDYDSVGLIFADEAHHMLGEMISDKLTKFNKHVPIIGFTATPEYETNRAVADMLTTEIFAMNIPDSIKSGILSPVKNVLYRSSIVCDLEKVPSSTNGDIDYKKMKISPNTLATEIARIYAEGVDEDTGIEFRKLKAIVNCPNAEIANLQAAKINEIMGHEVAISLNKVGISNKKYDRLQQDFIDGKYTIACQVGTMTEGFDDVTVSMCINYPTRSRVKAEQAAGRAIRLDDNNPNKIAFVVDTIFRNTPEASNEDILYTVSNSKQVLFKDIAGGMILFPRDFRGGRKGGRGRNKPEFVDFDLITDSTTLIELNRNAEERIANETIEEKTEEWLSASELGRDKTFPINKTDVINNKLQELQPEMPNFIQKHKSGRHIALCLHRDARYMFLEKAGITNYPPKTEEWLSVKDLIRDQTFPMNNAHNIKSKMEELQPEMPDFIKMQKSQTAPCLCLHRDARYMFLEKAGITNYPPKTEEWQSALDLSQDPTFPMSTFAIINKKLQELEPKMSGLIQIRKPKKSVHCLCLHRDGRNAFLKQIAKGYPLKTEEWQSAHDLCKDPTFPMININKIRQNLIDFQDIFPNFIQITKPKKGVPCLCLHRDGRYAFLEKVNNIQTKEEYPPKTEEWQSAYDLCKDSTFPMTKIERISEKLKQFQPEMSNLIQMRKPRMGRACLCLYREARELFLEKSKIKNEPLKTKDWLSIEDLKKDDSFPMSNTKNIRQKLEKLEPEMSDLIQMRKTKVGKTCLCLHRDGKEEFLKKIVFIEYPPKTEEWHSALDLSKDKMFPMGGDVSINKKLKKLEPEMSNLIQMRKSKMGKPCLCLHRDGREEFLRSVQESKTKSMKKAATGIAAVNNIIETSKNVKSTAEPGTNQK